MKLLKGKKAGFTLVELLVVMAIIGVLTGIGLPRFLKMTESSKVSTFKANHRIMQSSIAMYIADKDGDLPASEGDVHPYLAGGTTLDERPKNSTYVIDTNGMLTSTLSNLNETYTATNLVDGATFTGGVMVMTFTP